MYIMRRRRIKRRRKIKGRGIQRPYINKRNRLMLGKRKQTGGFIGPMVAAAAPALLQAVSSIFSR